MRSTSIIYCFIGIFMALSVLEAPAQNLNKKAWTLHEKALRCVDNPSLRVMYYTEAIRLDQKHPSYWANRAEAYIALANYQQAITDLDTALVYLPNWPRYLQHRAAAKSKLPTPDYDGALKDLQQSIKHGDDDYFAYYFSSDIYFAQKKYALADSFALLAIGLDSNQASGWLSLANVHLAQRKYKSVINITNKLINIPTHIYLHTTHALRGDAYAGIMQIDSAEACYRRAHKLNPVNFHAVMKLGQIAFAKKDYKNAQNWYERVWPANSLDSISRVQYEISLSKLPKPQKLIAQKTRFSGCTVSEKKKPDPAEALLTPKFSINRAPLPEKVDLSNNIHTMLNQGQQGSCVGHALTYLKIYHEKKETNQWHVFSPAFIYNQVNKGSDDGCQITDALNLLQKKGICPSSLMPYKEHDFLKQPDSAALRSAKKYRIEHYQSLYTLEEVKYQLNAGNPIVAAFIIDHNFIDLKAGQIWNTKGASLPKGKEGHAMLIVGFDDTKKAIKVINSWGRTWADQGFGWIDYAMFDSNQYALFVTKDAINSDDYDYDKPYVYQPEIKPTPVDPWHYHQYYVNELGNDYLKQLSTIYTEPVQQNVNGGMVVRCGVNVPPLAGYQVQVALYFYYSGTNMPVPYMNYYYATYAQQLSTASNTLVIGYQGLNQPCNFFVPYTVFPMGRGSYYFIPVLYIDNIGIKQGQPVLINVERQF